jgi:glyoxylase-like metal-dependent hydrolase (beta-lactamase superfamily II)
MSGPTGADIETETLTGNTPMPTYARPVLSRRGFCLCCLAATAWSAGAGWLSPRETFARARTIVDAIRADAAEASITLHAIRGDVSVLTGSGGNIGVLARPEGKVLIDAGITASRPRIAVALARLGGGPVTHLINTHWHFDHADGNEWLAEQGAVVLAHANAAEHLAAATRVEDWDFDFPPSPRSAIPARTVLKNETVELNGVAFALEHHPGAHTDGDLTVRFDDADVVHTGDIYWNGSYPFIDHSTGGTIDGTITAVEAILAAATDRTVVIPGHGRPDSNRAELAAYRDMLVAVRERVATLKKQGRTLAETIAAVPTAAYDDTWGRFVITPALFTKLVYQSV